MILVREAQKKADSLERYAYLYLDAASVTSKEKLYKYLADESCGVLTIGVVKNNFNASQPGQHDPNGGYGTLKLELNTLISEIFGFPPNDEVWLEGTYQEFSKHIENLRKYKLSLVPNSARAEHALSRLTSLNLFVVNQDGKIYQKKPFNIHFKLICNVDEASFQQLETGIGLKAISIKVETNGEGKITNVVNSKEQFNHTKNQDPYSVHEISLDPEATIEIRSDEGVLDGLYEARFSEIVNLNEGDEVTATSIALLKHIIQPTSPTCPETKDFEAQRDYIESQIISRVQAKMLLSPPNENGEITLSRHVIQFARREYDQ